MNSFLISSMNMKLKSNVTWLVCDDCVACLCAEARVSGYLVSLLKSRVKDALNRMTLEEKVKMIHAQSKFSSAGVPRLGIPKYGLPTVLMVSVRKCCGMNGIRLDGQTILVLPIRH